MSTCNEQIGKRLAQLRASLGEPMRKMAVVAGVSGKTWSRWEAGGSDIPSDALAAICNEYGLSPIWILFGTGPLTVSGTLKDNDWFFQDPSNEEYMCNEIYGTSRQAPQASGLLSHGLQGANGSLTSLPYLDIEASAGHGSIVEREETSFMVAFDRDWLRREVGVAPQHLRLIKARGDSMNSGKGLSSDIYDDDILLVDTSVERIESDAAYIIQFDGYLVVKRMQKMFDGSVSIISSNPEYATQIVSVEQTPDIRIAGKVVYMIAGRRV